MSSPAASGRANPFATRHTRPGRLVPRDATGAVLDVAGLADRALRLGAAAIVGPHGAGKTNLLTALADEYATAGRHAGTRRARRDAAAILRAVWRARSGTILCVDGWETLGRVWSAVIRGAARCRRVGLVVTAHRAADLPVLVTCSTTPALLARLVADLPDHGGLIRDADIAAAHEACRGDVREALYDLYDRFERRARRA